MWVAAATAGRIAVDALRPVIVERRCKRGRQAAASEHDQREHQHAEGSQQVAGRERHVCQLVTCPQRFAYRLRRSDACNDDLQCFDFVLTGMAGLAWFQRADDLLVPKSELQPFVSIEAGIGW